MNKSLNNHKYSIVEYKDEFYTTYEAIEEELQYYTEAFKNKVVYCNADNPLKSNFCRYFTNNFNELHLKKLICTSFNFKGKGLLYEFDGDKFDIEELKGSGDFGSEECINILKQCDICCTNPPFSLFRNLFSLLNKYNKEYLLVANMNCLTYKEIFPYVMRNECWIGSHFGNMDFKVPSIVPSRVNRFKIDRSGQKWISIGSICWLTNINNTYKYPEIVLDKQYNKADYPKYDNFNAINVTKVKDIPMDYGGVIGVPITYIKYHYNSPFKIIGKANNGSKTDEYDLFKPTIKGKALFKRLLIQHI